jgi:glycosyltransferase involved in cell wall biosynthesis
MKKKIAVIGAKGFPAFGGAAGANENIVNQLKSSYEYTIYSISTHTDKKGFYNGYNQIVFNGAKGKRLNTLVYYLKSLFHALFFGDYDIVQVNHLASGFIVPFLRLRFKVVATARGIFSKKTDNKWNSLDHLAFELSAHLFCKFSNITVSVSKPHIDVLKKYTSKQIQYIPNGIHVNQLEKKQGSSGYLLFAASRIILLKGCHVFLEALNRLNHKGKVIIIGDLSHTPKYSAELMSLSKNLNIEYVDLIKDKNILFNYIKNAEIFIFPSFNEGMSNMLLEVASLKTPIICSDIPENTAVFNENEIEFFKTGDSLDLADKIKYSLENKDVLEKKSENAFAKLNEIYRWEIIAKEYKKVYDSL